MQAPAQSAASKVQAVQKGSIKGEGTFHKSEKTKDIRSTNITAAKGISLSIFF